MKVIFVDNFFCQPSETTQSVAISPHLGLLSLSAVLLSAGHDVEIFDPKLHFAKWRLAAPDIHFVERCAQAIADGRPDVLGCTAYGLSFPFAAKLATRLKELCPETPIALGGPHPTIVAADILREFRCFDVVVRFEAERTICALVEALSGSRRLMHIPNLMIRAGGSPFPTRRDESLVELDTLPHLPFGMYPVRELGLVELPVEAGRGCPFPCTFCSTSSFFKRKYRLKSPGRLLDEMDHLHREWQIRDFSLNHDLFGLKKSAVLEFCDLVQDRGYAWKCSMRPDLLPQPLLERMAEAGCKMIFFGIESGSARMQQTMQKRLDLDAARDALRRVDALGLRSVASFVVGFPEEEARDQNATLDMASELLLSSERIEVQTHMLSPEPGSRLLEERASELEFDGLGPELGGLTDAQMIGASAAIFSVYYHFKGRVPHWQSLVARSALECYEELLGRPLLMHVLEVACEGRLSVLVQRLLSHPPPASHSPQALKGFMREALWRYGLGDACPEYLMDVVRFVTRFGVLRPLEARPRLDWQAATRITLASGVLLERFWTDPVRALDRILRAPRTELSEGEAGEPSAYVVFVSGSDYHVRALPYEWGTRLSDLARPTGYDLDLATLPAGGREIIESLGNAGLLEAV